MKTKLIVPLTKSPKPNAGRIGPDRLQDWYTGLVKAAKMAKQFPTALVHVISNVHVKGAPHEADLYHETLLALGVPREQIRVVREGLETIAQVEIAFREARKDGADVVFISSPLHFPRVNWLCDSRAMNCVAWGLPRFKEALTDPVLIFAFPIIDTFGGRGWFQRLTSKRRQNGVQ